MKLKAGSLKNFPKKVARRNDALIVGVFPKLEKFLLNPQVQICSIAVPGTSRNYKRENREPTRGRSLTDPCPAMVSSACRPSNIIESDKAETHHKYKSTIVFEIIFSKPASLPILHWSSALCCQGLAVTTSKQCAASFLLLPSIAT